MTDDNPGASLVIERTLDAPPEAVWLMWTDAQHFAEWYGPPGATITVVTMDVRVGGTRLLRMEAETPDGPMQMWFTGVYVEVVENGLLVYTDAMSDELGNVFSAEQTGMPAGHPTTTQVRVELEPTAAGTRLVLTHVGIPPDSPGATGWMMALEKLSAHLTAIS